MEWKDETQFYYTNIFILEVQNGHLSSQSSEVSPDCFARSLSGAWGVLLAPCSSVGGRRGHGSRSRPQVGAAGHGCRFPPSIDARLSRRRAQHGLLRAQAWRVCTGAWPPLRTVTRARLAPTSRTSTTRTTWCCCRICGAGVETKRGSRPRWLEPHTSDAPSRTSIAVRFWLAWSSGQARRV